jgi:hypothetical protein
MTTLQETSVPEMTLLQGTMPEETSLENEKVAAEGSDPTEDVEPVRHDDNEDIDEDMEWDGVTTPGKNTDPRTIATGNQPIVGSREYWENVIFPEHAIAKNTIGFDFLDDLLSGKTSITDSGEPQRVREEQYRQLINLYNSLKLGKEIPTTGNVLNLMHNILTKTPGMSTLDKEAGGYWSNENPKEEDRDDDMEEKDVDNENEVDKEDVYVPKHIGEEGHRTQMMSPRDIGRRIAASITQSQTQMDTLAEEDDDGDDEREEEDENSVNQVPSGNTETPQSKKMTVTHEAVGKSQSLVNFMYCSII